MTIVRAIGATFLLRALMPVGYMPAALGDGLPFVLCPDNLPVTVAAALDTAGHGHDHAGHEASAIDQCDFGELAPDVGATVDLPEHRIDFIPPVSSATPVHRLAGRSIIRPVARGPPA